MKRSALRFVVAGLVLGWIALAWVVPAQDSQRRRGFSIAITEPANQEVVFGKTRLAAEVKVDNAELIDRVEFVVGGEVVFIDREAPFECFHDFGEAQRSWVVRAVAYHKEGVTVSDAVISRKLKFATIEKVNRVILWITATDRQGNLVRDLTRDELRVLEDGKDQELLDFYNEDRPITLAMLIDTSGSMRDKIDKVHDAAGAFVDTLRPIDRALIIDFDDKVFLIQQLTAEHEALKTSLESTTALGGTAIYDAVHAAYRKIGSIDGRKTMILLSDGVDESSQFSFKRVLNEAKSNNSMIFTIGIGGGMGGGGKTNALKEFAGVTGGGSFFVKKAEELGRVYQRIADELGTQYYLTYATTNDEWDGRWIKLKVESTRPGVKIRARRGYFAVRGHGGA